MPAHNPDGPHKLNILGIRKGKESYFFFFDDASIDATGKVIHRFASEPDLSLSWHEASLLGERLREIKAKLPEFDQGDDSNHHPGAGGNE